METGYTYPTRVGSCALRSTKESNRRKKYVFAEKKRIKNAKDTSYPQKKPNNALRAIVQNHKIKIIVEKAIVFFYIFREYTAIILCNALPLHYCTGVLMLFKNI